MHKYLSAVGFKSVDTREKMEQLLNYCEESFQTEKTVSIRKDVEFSERKKYFAKNLGIMLCGEYNDQEKYHREFYIPFFEGTGDRVFEEMALERHMSRNSYAGTCEFEGIGISIIYFVQNGVEYLSELNFQQFSKESVSLTLSGLASEGMILLPGVQSKMNLIEKEEYLRVRSQTIKEAKAGNQEAIDSLTMEDMNTYSMISRRLETEDVMSIVSTYFMPHGLECDQYHIMGEIISYCRRENSLTKEQVYVMTLDCNGLVFDICINAEDLMGEPEIGRRFKGGIWLQGRLNFHEKEF